MNDLISRQAAIEAIVNTPTDVYSHDRIVSVLDGAAFRQNEIIDIINELPSAHPETDKYEYHYDHTDCIWYRPEAHNRCPVTCAQYRDGWNDAMNYIFRDGKGYMPYRRDKQYGE